MRRSEGMFSYWELWLGLKVLAVNQMNTRLLRNGRKLEFFVPFGEVLMSPYFERVFASLTVISKGVKSE